MKTDPRNTIGTNGSDDTASPFAAFKKLLVATRYADDAEPNQTGCVCSCPACRADDCINCLDD